MAKAIWKTRLTTLLDNLTPFFPGLVPDFEEIRKEETMFKAEDKLLNIFEFVVDESARGKYWSVFDAMCVFLHKHKNDHHFLYTRAITSSPYLDEIVTHSNIGTILYQELNDLHHPENNDWSFLEGRSDPKDWLTHCPTKILAHVINHQLISADQLLDLLDQKNVKKIRDQITLNASDISKKSDWHPNACTTLVESFGLLPTFIALLKHYDVQQSSEHVFLNAFFTQHRQRDLRESDAWKKLRQITLHVLWFEDRNHDPLLSAETRRLLQRESGNEKLTNQQKVMLDIAFDANTPFTHSLIPLLESNTFEWKDNTLCIGSGHAASLDHSFEFLG